MKYAIFLAALALAGCDNQLAWYDHPTDTEVQSYAMERCLTLAKGPTRTHYNDADEVVSECRVTAMDLAKYCPYADMERCDGSYRRTRADVRKMLPAKDTPQ